MNIKELDALGIDFPSSNYQDSMDKNIEATYLTALIRFLKGQDFMKVGQAIHRQHWEAAYMTVRRLEMCAKELGFKSLERNWIGLKQAIQRKNTEEAKQILTLIINKRVQLLKILCK